MRHHEDGIRAAVERLTPGAEALVVVGSVARGTERDDSDIDAYLVVDEESHARAGGRVSWIEQADDVWPGLYFDLKLVTRATLEAAADRGDDPMRASLEGARVVWTAPGVDGIADVVARIPQRGDDDWEELAGSFIAQARLYGGYFLPQGESLGNPFLTHYAAVHLHYSAARALLADARVLFRGPKYLTAQLAGVRQPDGFDTALTALLSSPTAMSGRAVLSALEGHRAWPVEADDSLGRFVSDNEFAWLTGIQPPEFR